MVDGIFADIARMDKRQVRSVSAGGLRVMERWGDGGRERSRAGCCLPHVFV